MSNEKYQPYKPEEPVSEAERKREQQEIRDASKHAAQEMAGEELGDTSPADPTEKKQAEKELHDAARKAKQQNQNA